MIFVCIAIGLAYCLSAAVTSAAESTREMNELLTNYYMYFVNISEDDTYTSDTFGSESQHECKDDAQSVHNTASENPYYVILGKADSLVELKKLYRQLAPQIHPDTTEQYSTEEATHQFTLLNEAYTYWKDWFNRQN